MYRFRLYDGVTYTTPFDTGVNKFKLNNFVGLLTGTSYSVEVAVKMVTEPNFGPYGSICTIISPAVFKMNVQNSNAFEFKAVAYPNPFASSFLLDVKTASESQIQYRVYDMLGKLLEDKTLEKEMFSTLEIGAAYPTGIYNIIITQENNNSSLRVIKK